MGSLKFMEEMYQNEKKCKGFPRHVRPYVPVPKHISYDELISSREILEKEHIQPCERDLVKTLLKQISQEVENRNGCGR